MSDRDLHMAIFNDPEAYGYVRVPISRAIAETAEQRAARAKTKEPAPMLEYTAVMRKENLRA